MNTRVCSCGNPALLGRKLCGRCRNQALKERYASDEVYRAKRVSLSRAAYRPGQKKEIYNKMRERALDVLGGPRCGCCGFSDLRALQIDHVAGDGYAKRKKGEHGQRLYASVIKTGGVGYQVLCANCNWIKKVEEGNTGGVKGNVSRTDGFTPVDYRPVKVIPDLVTKAQQAYEAYGEVTSWKNYAGLPMPTWSQLPSKIQEAWCAATKNTLSG